MSTSNPGVLVGVIDATTPLLSPSWSPSLSAASGAVDDILASPLLGDERPFPSTSNVTTPVEPEATTVTGFNMEDGNLFLKTEGVTHRVHWSVVRLHSQYFQDLYREHTDAGTLRGIVHLEWLKSVDVYRFLQVLYPNDLQKPSLVAQAEWQSVLHVSHELKFLAVRSIAIEALFPLASPVDKLVLGQKYGISHWLLDAYVSVCTREGPIVLHEAERLGVANVITITHARLMIAETLMTADEIRYTVWQTCCPTLEVPELEWLRVRRTDQGNLVALDPLAAAEHRAAECRAKAYKQHLLTEKAERMCREAEENVKKLQGHEKQEGDSIKMGLKAALYLVGIYFFLCCIL